jgi:hypothetical protein
MFYDNRFCIYITEGVIGWHLEIYWHFTDFALKCDGNFLQTFATKKTFSFISFLRTALVLDLKFEPLTG